MYSLYINKLRPYLILCFLVVATTVILWLPFILHLKSFNGLPIGDRATFQTVLKHWDGLLYIIPAKTWYNPHHPIMQQAVLGLSPQYFAAHLPMYPLSLYLFSWAIGFPKSLLVSTVIASMALFCAFYYVCKKYNMTHHPLLLSSVMLLLAPRFLVVRSVGSSEPLSMVLIFLSLFAFAEKKWVWTGVAGALAIITRSPAIFLCIGYGLFAIYEWIKTKKINLSYIWLLLIPLGLLSVFMLYYVQYGDFFVYFKGNENAHLAGVFGMFNYSNKWVGTVWLEDIVFYLLVYTSAVVLLLRDFWKKNIELSKERFLLASGLFSGVYLFSLYFVQHIDIARYSLPLLPFALIAGEKLFTKKWFILALCILAFGIYMYSWNFMLINIAPVTDWKPFL